MTYRVLLMRIYGYFTLTFDQISLSSKIILCLNGSEVGDVNLFIDMLAKRKPILFSSDLRS